MSRLQKYIEAITEKKTLINQISTHGIELILPGKKQLNFQEAKLYLQHPLLLHHFHSLVKQLLKKNSLVDSIGVENIKHLRLSLEMFEKTAVQLNKKDNQYLDLIKDCHQLLNKIDSICYTDFFKFESNPIILELKDYVASVKKDDDIHQKIAKVLSVIAQLGTPLLGTNNQNQHRSLHLPCYSAAKKLISLLKHKKNIVFDINESIALFKGRLGMIMEKYQIKPELIEQHTEKKFTYRYKN
jgi:hypothetical protein